MTVAAGTRKISYTGTGANTVLSTVFPFFEADDLEVQKRVTATGVVTVLTLGVHYTVAAPATQPGVGSVTPIDGATDFPASVTWTIVRTTDREQETDYVPNDPFPAETHERALDRLTLIAQEVDEDASRGLRFPVSDSTSLESEIPSSVERASKYLAFDANGEPIASSGVPDDSVPVSAFAETLLDDADAATARATLDAQEDLISARGDVLRGSAAGIAERLAKGAANTFLGSDGTDSLFRAILSAWITHTPLSPVTGATLQAAVDQLTTQRPSTTNQTSTQDDIGTSEVALSDLDNLTIPGSPDGNKAYVVLGQVTLKGIGAGGGQTVRLRVGPLGTISDPLIAESIISNGVVNNSTVAIPPKPFTPASGDKVTISVVSPSDGNADVDARAVCTFASIVQLTNV